MSLLANLKQVYVAMTGSPAATDLVWTSGETTITGLNGDIMPRIREDGFPGEVDAGTTARKGKAFSIPINFAGSGVAATPPRWGRLMRACGISEVIGASSVTYSPLGPNATHESCSIRGWQHNEQHDAASCRGTFTITLKSSEFPQFVFDMLGFYSAPTNANFTAGTYGGQASPLLVNSTNTTTVTMGGTAVRLSEFTFTWGVEVTLEDFGGTNGNYTRITNYAPTASITVLKPAAGLSAFDPYQRHNDQVIEALSIVHGPSGGNRLTFGMSYSYGQPVDTAVGTQAAWQIPLLPKHTSGQMDHFSLVQS